MQNVVYLLTMFLAAALFAYNAIILFLKGKNNRGRRILAYTHLVWGTMFFTFFICQLLAIPVTRYPMLSHQTLILSNFIICIMFFFPLEVVMPGWLNAKRLTLLFLPSVGTTSIYFLGLWLTGERIEELFVFSDIFASLGHFNVWYRGVMLLCNLVYSFFLLRFIYHREKEYERWEEEGFSDRETMHIAWMHYYFNILLLFIFLYLWVVILGKQWLIILDTWVSVIAFSVLFYKGLFHENPYPELFYQRENVQVHVFSKEERAGAGPVEQGNPDFSFESKIPIYVHRLQEWMDTEKPYLYRDFKLTDASRVLPLNRTYLSRLFNEGFHQTFNEVVRAYRIEYAKAMLVQHPEMAIYEVAEASGFASDSGFIKAFQKVAGCTPKQYKNKSILKD